MEFVYFGNLVGLAQWQVWIKKTVRYLGHKVGGLRIAKQSLKAPMVV